MRRMQFMLTGLPGRRMHHHGRTADGIGSADLGGADSRGGMRSAPGKVKERPPICSKQHWLKRTLMVQSVLTSVEPAMRFFWCTERRSKAMGILIKGGKVVSAATTRLADVLVEGETIAQVAPDIQSNGHRVVDATGMLVLPGGIDVHTHLDMPFGGTMSADDYECGTRAAAIGGTTTVIDFALQ